MVSVEVPLTLRRSQRPFCTPPKVVSPASVTMRNALYCETPELLTIAPRLSTPAPETVIASAFRFMACPDSDPPRSSVPPASMTVPASAVPKAALFEASTMPLLMTVGPE